MKINYLKRKPSLRVEFENALFERLSINDDFDVAIDKVLDDLTDAINKYLEFDLRPIISNIEHAIELYSYIGPHFKEVKRTLQALTPINTGVFLHLMDINTINVSGSKIMRHVFKGQLLFMNKSVGLNFNLFDVPTYMPHKSEEDFIYDNIINEFDPNTCSLTITLPAFSSIIDKEDLLEAIPHEFFHTYQIPKLNMNVKETYLYEVACKLMDDEHQNIEVKQLANSIYSTNKREIDANLNSLYQRLKRVNSTNIEEYWKIINNSNFSKNIEFNDVQFYYIFLENPTDIFFIKQLECSLIDAIKIFNDNLQAIYNKRSKLTLNQFKRRLKDSRKYAISKLGKILARITDLKKIDLRAHSNRIY